MSLRASPSHGQRQSWVWRSYVTAPVVILWLLTGKLPGCVVGPTPVEQSGWSLRTPSVNLTAPLLVSVKLLRYVHTEVDQLDLDN